jgi:hypothetical protein
MKISDCLENLTDLGKNYFFLFLNAFSVSTQLFDDNKPEDSTVNSLINSPLFKKENDIQIEKSEELEIVSTNNENSFILNQDIINVIKIHSKSMFCVINNKLESLGINDEMFLLKNEDEYIYLFIGFIMNSSYCKSLLSLNEYINNIHNINIYIENKINNENENEENLSHIDKIDILSNKKIISLVENIMTQSRLSSIQNIDSKKLINLISIIISRFINSWNEIDLEYQDLNTEKNYDFNNKDIIEKSDIKLNPNLMSILNPINEYGNISLDVSIEELFDATINSKIYSKEVDNKKKLLGLKLDIKTKRIDKDILNNIIIKLNSTNNNNDNIEEDNDYNNNNSSMKNLSINKKTSYKFVNTSWIIGQILLNGVTITQCIEKNKDYVSKVLIRRVFLSKILDTITFVKTEKERTELILSNISKCFERGKKYRMDTKSEVNIKDLQFKKENDVNNIYKSYINFTRMSISSRMSTNKNNPRISINSNKPLSSMNSQNQIDPDLDTISKKCIGFGFTPEISEHNLVKILLENNIVFEYIKLYMDVREIKTLCQLADSFKPRNLNKYNSILNLEEDDEEEEDNSINMEEYEYNNQNEIEEEDDDDDDISKEVLKVMNKSTSNQNYKSNSIKTATTSSNESKINYNKSTK